ncbi:MAG: bcrC [Chthoniobacteraceae bacterium]|nr:bcrC [Chthoniobacteraceae bacterium]
MDQKLLFLINREWTSPALDWVMTLASAFDVWLFPILALILLVVVFGRFTGRACLLTAVCIVGINDGLVSNPIKHLVDRPRPFQSHNDVRQLALAKARPRILAIGQPLKVKLSRSSLQDVEGRSFPSSHTINMISVALVCAVFYRRFGWLAFGPALLVGYSRIYTGSHWPSDVITTIFLGLGSTLFLLVLAGWIWRKVGKRVLPDVFAQYPRLFESF